jgi:hypothetical protein
MYVVKRMYAGSVQQFPSAKAPTIYAVELPKKFEIVINLERRTFRGEAFTGASAKAWQMLSYNLAAVLPTVLLRQRPELWSAEDACLISVWLGYVHITL